MQATARNWSLPYRPAAAVAALVLVGALAACASETSPAESPAPASPAQTSPAQTSPAKANRAPPAGPHAAAAKALSINTPVSAIAANPAGKAVLEHDLPGLLERPEYNIFKNMSVKSLAGLSNGKITPQALDQVQHDLQTIPAGDAAPSSPQPAPQR
jgi:hypothetical protein